MSTFDALALLAHGSRDLAMLACGLWVLSGVGGCAGAGSGEPIASGQVEVHLLGAPVQGGAPCGGGEGAVVWADQAVDAVRPGHGVVRFSACGPRPSTTVLPAGSTVVVRNEGTERLDLRWRQGQAQGHATLAVGGEQRVVLGEAGRLELEGDGAAATVVPAPVGGEVDAQGHALLTGLPVGPQHITVRHPEGGERITTVTVPDGARVVVDLEWIQGVAGVDPPGDQARP